MNLNIQTQLVLSSQLFVITIVRAARLGRWDGDTYLVTHRRLLTEEETPRFEVFGEARHTKESVMAMIARLLSDRNDTEKSKFQRKLELEGVVVFKLAETEMPQPF